MKNMTSLLAVSVFALASAVNALASQDAGTRSPRVEGAAAAHIVKTSYVPSALVQASQEGIGVSANESAKSVAEEKSLGNELPQNSTLTLLAGLAIIVVIGKRRMSN